MISFPDLPAERRAVTLYPSLLSVQFFGTSMLQHRVNELTPFADMLRRTIDQYATERYNATAELLAQMLESVQTIVEQLRIDHTLLSTAERASLEYSFDVSLKQSNKILRAAIKQDLLAIRNTFAFPILDSALRQAQYGKSRNVTDLSAETVWNLMGQDYLRR